MWLADLLLTRRGFAALRWYRSVDDEPAAHLRLVVDVAFAGDVDHNFVDGAPVKGNGAV